MHSIPPGAPPQRRKLGTMAGLFSNARRSCYFCHQVEASEAYAAHICMRHQALISLRLLVRLARCGRFGKFWRVMIW